MNSFNYSLLLSCFFLIVASSIISQPVVHVYMSSEQGDRLKPKKNLQFGPTSADNISNTIIINDQQQYQRMEGFGATFNEAGMICLNALSSKAKQKVLISLFDSVKGAGFTLMKSPIAACDFASAGLWYSYNNVPDDSLMNHFSISRDLAPNGLIHFITSAKRYGKFQIESVMDFAPDWMYYSLKPGEKHIIPRYYPALARYYSRFIQSYAEHGITIGYLNLFNEAHNSWYSNETYSEIGMLIKNYVAPQLQHDNLTTKIQLGETSNRPEALEKFPPILNDPEIRSYVHSLTVHGYDWNKFASLTELHNKYPNLPIWQTEVCYAYGPQVNNVPPGSQTIMPVYEFSDGAFWGNMIIGDMNNWASGWIYWNMILDQKGGPWLVSKKHGDPDHNYQHPVVVINRYNRKVFYTGLYYYLSHFSRFVRPGAYRINSAGNTSTYNWVAFKNADHSIVVNVINNGNASNCNLLWHGQSIRQRLPKHSITTFKWTTNE